MRAIHVLCLALVLFFVPVSTLAKSKADKPKSAAEAIASDTPQAAPSSTKLRGGVSKDDLIGDLESRFGVQCSMAVNKPYKATITKVRLGSAAIYAGLTQGDHILQATKEKNAVRLEIERDGKIYSAKLAPQQPLLADVTPPARMLLESDLAKKPKENDPDVFVQRDIVLIIDASGSMARTDCPGGLSRWEWCATQSIGLMSEGERKIKEVTIAIFDSGFEVFARANLKKVEEVFATRGPGSATWTAGPMEDRFKEYFARRAREGHIKPLLMVVITDGEPNIPGGYEGGKEAVEKAIIHATAQMHDGSEVRIAFLEVGNSAVGPDFLYNLDHMLIYRGAKYDIVTTKSFPDLIRIGLKRAIIEAITDPGDERIPGGP